MNRLQFIQQFAKVELIGDTNNYGHYPFMGHVTNGDKTECLALAFDGDVESVYDTIKNKLASGCDIVYVVLDLPPILDIESDFMCVMSATSNEIVVSAIPYNISTGELSEEITTCKALDGFKKQSERFIYG